MTCSKCDSEIPECDQPHHEGLCVDCYIESHPDEYNYKGDRK
jgi:hypothetical protein